MILFSRYRNWLLIFICFLIEDKCFGDDVVGCMGFVKSDIGDIDFAQVEVKMFTKQGSLKDHTECAPNNGYYFLPLYDKGEYVLKVAPPLGWNFEPSEVTINVDGATDPCSLGIDINFELQGFAVTGQVTSLDNSVGPKGIVVNMLSVTSSDVLLTTITEEGGSFILSPVKPGQYIVEVSHERWILSKKRVSVSVKSGNAEVPTNSLVVSGYDVSGTVTSDSEPIMGVSFVLFQKVDAKRIAVIGCDSTALTGFSPTGKDLKQLIPICHVASDAKGKFTFPSLPPGHYTIIPHYKGLNSIKFDVQPQHVAFEVQHGSFELPITFQVKGFSVDGRVLWGPKGKPLEGATVMLNQKMISKTRSDGVFNLDSMTPGIYKLKIQARDLLFEEQDVKVTPNTPHIGDLVPTAYKVCGKVSASQGGSTVANRLVEFVNEEASEVDQATTDSAGEFCIFLPPASYTVSLPISEMEKINGLQFAPLKRTVKVMDSPVTGVEFSQLQATVKGHIRCLNSPCPEIAVSLHSLDTVTTFSKGGNYVFENVLPGEYTITVPSEEWCWNKDEFALSVTSEQVVGPKFVQTGLPITFISSHATKIRYKTEDNEFEPKHGNMLELDAGNNRLCVSELGTYIIEPIGCHGYTVPSFQWTGGVLVLTAISHLYTGRVLSSELVSDIVINVIPSDESTATSSSVRRLGPLVGVSGKGRTDYVFSLQLYPGESVTLMPAASSLLFTPMSAAVVGTDDCVTGVVFKAERGQIVEGRVLGNNIPVPGASVTIYNTQDQLIATQVTDVEGRYMFGPLSANTKYNVTAEKEGYVLTGPNSKGEFSAHKLAEVIVTVKDKADGQPLQGVLLSLSGGENYRRNSQTGPEGTMAFLSLSPSEYYLRPMMKEYKFDPPSKMIAVKEGATIPVTLSGERVAYSVFGSVTSLSGDAEPGVVVEAVGLGLTQCSQLQEESTTEASGQFRIRGLHPQCQYTVRVKQGPQVNQHIQRSTPEGILAKVTKEDIHGLNIIVFRPISRTDITVYVVAESPENLRSLRVKMFRDDTTVHSVRLSTLKSTPSFALTSTALVFPPVPADGRTYSIQLESSLSQKTHNYKTNPVYFKANTSFQVVRLNFVTTTQASDNELSHMSYLTLPLMLLALLVFYNKDTAKTMANTVTRLMESKLSTPDNSSFNQLDDSSGETVMVEQIPIKKKIKQRKT